MLSKIQKLVLISLVGLFFDTSSAQTFFFQNPKTDQTRIGIRYLRPNFEGDDDFSIFTGAYDLSVQIPFSSGMDFIVDLPFIAYSRDDDDSEKGIGNMFIGICSRPSAANHSSHVSFGIFLPTISDEKYIISSLGGLSNYYELQKYFSNTLTLFGNFSYYHRTYPQRGILGFEIGPSVLIPTKEEDYGRNAEIIGHYGLTAGYRFSSLAIFAELLGCAIITEEDIDAGERFIHSVAFGAQWNHHVIRPGLFYQIYLDEDLRDFIDGVLGIKMDIVLP